MRRACMIVGGVVVVAWAFTAALGGCGGDDGAGVEAEQDAAPPSNGTSGSNGAPDGSSGSSGDGGDDSDGGGDGGSSSSGGNPGKITCGAVECNAGAQACCRSQDEESCVDESDNCVLDARFACDETADCPGTEICCASVVGPGPRADCSASCNALEVRLCKTDADCGDEGPCAEKSCSGNTLRICGDGTLFCD